MKKLLLTILAVLLLTALVSCDGAVNEKLFKEDLPDSVKFFWSTGNFQLTHIYYYELNQNGGISYKIYLQNTWIDVSSLMPITLGTYSFSPTLNLSIAAEDAYFYKTNDFLSNITSYKELSSLDKMYKQDGGSYISLVNLENSVAYFNDHDTFILKEGENVCYWYDCYGDLTETTYSFSSNGLEVVIPGGTTIELLQNNNDKITSFEMLKNATSIKDNGANSYTQIFNYAD